MIPEDKVAEVRERTDLVALVSEYVSLKRSGSSLKGLCPFHGEKTPSFYVHPDRGFFHCFGCQASGDAISFLMRIDGHAFPEAVRILAERAGVEIVALDSAEEKAARQARARRERLHSVVESAAGFFVKMLSQHKFGAMAWEELRRRDIHDATVERFRLGYAPHAWDDLATHLAGLGYSPTDCEQVGLTVPRRRGHGHYDRFRHRLVFPVSDAHGRIVAFSGRALDPPPGEDRGDRDPPAKYVNSPETTLYKKSDVLFGLHEARVELRRRDVALMCEGNFDVLALSQAGFAHVVAPLGTAFTAPQAKLLRRYASTVVLLFDSDRAGRKAARAAQPLLAQAGLAGKVVNLPPGDDPDSFLRSHGADAMQRLIDAAPSIVDWMIASAADEAGTDPRAKAEHIESLGPVLASIDNPVEARLYVDRVAKAFEVPDVQVVRQQLRRGVRAARGGRRRRPEPGPSAQPAPRRPSVRASKTELDLVGAFLDFPSLHASDCAKNVQELLTSDDLRAIFRLTARWVGARGVDAATLLEELGNDSPTREWLERRLALQGFEDEASARTFVDRALADLRTRRIERESRRLKRLILEARNAGDDERATALTRQRMELFRSARGDAPRTGAEGTKR
ncbi:MAG TPA: DNA primase [Sandaracinaceae bacterium LLY-WYZ-13_1]|nr:DNA primase [Sandaracinaceae bacterium LLY-WYZ-13_1]